MSHRAEERKRKYRYHMTRAMPLNSLVILFNEICTESKSKFTRDVYVLRNKNRMRYHRSSFYFDIFCLSFPFRSSALVARVYLIFFFFFSFTFVYDLIV